MRTIAITGATGFIGCALTKYLQALGCRVRPLVRPGKRAEDAIAWDPERGTVDHAALEGVDALVHLAGENVADGRWTAAKKQRIRASRVRGTALLAAALGRVEHRPRVWLSASAVGYYGDRGELDVDESGPCGDDFLASVVADWEAAAAPARALGVRVVHPRFGIVLDPEGGALAKMLTPFRLGLGGPIGSGRQYMSWIALIDTVRALVHMLEHEELSGPCNVTAPVPVTNAELTKTLGAVLARPTALALPGFLARLALGEMAEGALLAGVRARPRRLLESGFHFEQPDLRRFLAQVLA